MSLSNSKYRHNTALLHRSLLIASLDALGIFVMHFVALFLRYELRYAAIPRRFLHTFLDTIFFFIAAAVLVLYLFRLYHSIWRFVGTSELVRLFGAYGILAVAEVFTIHFWPFIMPRSYYIIGFVLSMFWSVGIRFSYRLIKQLFRGDKAAGRQNGDNILIIGAGEAGRALIQEFRVSDKIMGQVKCLIDDNSNIWGSHLEGVPVVGGRESILEAVKEYHINKIIYAIPSSSGEVRRDILKICSETRCKVQTVPGMYQFVNGDVTLSRLRNVEIQDLLGRDAISVNLDEIYEYVKGKVILVTGGGGSIGSELCRQIAKAGPEQLIIFDVYENNAYDIQNELKRNYPELNLEVLIGSVRNRARLDYIMGTYHPEIVFHAAAHKHVPLMEDSPVEAIKNNTLGTYKTAKAAVEHGVKKFVLISTDKAVNPTNIMGASKRLCEMVVQMMDRHSETDFVAVRFGNVLGSNGSVIPLFKQQIEEGGPVTVTDPNIIRYFMTIPEAVSLVLQAACFAAGSEIFVLDMGEPVKIDDMARNLIRLSGYEPDVDIKIEYTGLRPGEKLYEELLMAEEGLKETANKLIHIGKPIEMDDELFRSQLERLEEACLREDPGIKNLVAQIVPTYIPDNGK